MELPGTPRVHVYAGLVLSVIGIGVGGYAYTGDRAYHIEFVFVAFLGFLLLAAGSLLTGYGQANRPRMGGRKAARKRKQEKAEEKAEEEDPGDEAKEPSGDQKNTEQAGAAPSRLSAMATALQGLLPTRSKEQITATIACPRCEHVFEATGDPPFETTCPNCEHVGQVSKPQDVQLEAGTRFSVEGSPRTGPVSEVDEEAVQDEDLLEGEQAPPNAPTPGLTQRVRHRMARAGSEPIEASLACSHCDHVFTAHGRPPLEVTCPNCGFSGILEGPS